MMIPKHNKITECVALIDGEYVVQLKQETYIRNILTDMVKEQCADRLSQTDWYVIRAAEGGAAVPADILSQRQAIRAKSNELEAHIKSADIADLRNFSWGWPV